MISKTMQTLAAVGASATYAQLEAATGLDMQALMSNIATLKGRGLVRRANAPGGRGSISIIETTPAGYAYLRGERPPARRRGRPVVVKPADVAEPIVTRAIRTRPALAVVWSSP